MVRSTAALLLLVTSLLCQAQATSPDEAADSPARRRPNIIFVLVDDMGFGDPSCYGNPDITTPSFDRLAEEGLRFTNFYVASPICSPSRVACTTGQYPSRYGITGHFASRKSNKKRGMPDYLDPRAPAVARLLKQAGYATAHFGKWHMGGGRDVDDAPLPSAYGFDESLVAFEGLGDRILRTDHNLSAASAKLGRGEMQYAPKHDWSRIYVDRCIDFIDRHRDEPFYLEFWPNDVHDPFLPTADGLKETERFKDQKYVQEYYAVLLELDRQFGRLLEAVDRAGLSEHTLIVLASDNGPADRPYHYEEHAGLPGRTGGLRGRKWSLYEGGIREPLLVRWPAHLPAGVVNDTTIIGAIDLMPTFVTMAGAELPDEEIDGEDMARAFLGKEGQRARPLFWDYGRSKGLAKPSGEGFRSPSLAIRDGRWKLLVNPDRSNVELYDLTADQAETKNVATEHPERASQLQKKLLEWYERTAPSVSKEAL